MRGSVVDSPEHKVPCFTWCPAGTRSFDTSPHSIAVRFVQHAFASLDGVRDALPNAAIVAASCASAGSVRGYDDLFPANPSVVSERRHPWDSGCCLGRYAFCSPQKGYQNLGYPPKAFSGLLAADFEVEA